jgi:hypothetical protein
LDVCVCVCMCVCVLYIIPAILISVVFTFILQCIHFVSVVCCFCLSYSCLMRLTFIFHCTLIIFTCSRFVLSSSAKLKEKFHSPKAAMKKLDRDGGGDLDRCCTVHS